MANKLELRLLSQAFWCIILTRRIEMKKFANPSIEFITFTEDDILTVSCPQHNCQNPLGYGDLCSGTGGHGDCDGFTPGCSSDDL